MDKIDQIKSHIHDLEEKLIKGACSAQVSMESACKAEAYNEVLAFIDSLEKEQPIIFSRELEVKEDAGGYPYIDKHIELYDYDTDTPLAKKGDKVIVQIRKAD